MDISIHLVPCSPPRNHGWHCVALKMEEGICCDVAAQLLSRAVNGYTADGGAAVEALGGGFRFCTLAQPIFDERGNIRAGVTFADLAAHVCFTESGKPIPKRNTGRTPLLGVHKSKAIYLLFSGVLGYRRPNGGNVLTSAVLKSLPSHDGPQIVFGEGCRIGAARLRSEGVVFKQVPYGIKVG